MEKKNMKGNLYKVSMVCGITATVLCIVGIIVEFVTKSNDYILWGLLLLCNVIILIGNASNRKNLK